MWKPHDQRWYIIKSKGLFQFSPIWLMRLLPQLNHSVLCIISKKEKLLSSDNMMQNRTYENNVYSFSRSHLSQPSTNQGSESIEALGRLLLSLPLHNLMLKYHDWGKIIHTDKTGKPIWFVNVFSDIHGFKDRRPGHTQSWVCHLKGEIFLSSYSETKGLC